MFITSKNIETSELFTERKGSVIKYLFGLFCLLLLIPFSGRLLLSLTLYERLPGDFLLIGQAFIYGLRLDAIVACTFLLIPALFLCFVPRILSGTICRILKAYLFSVITILIFFEVATFPFVNEYDVRPNSLFLEYLEYPKEIIGMIWATEKFYLAILIGLIVLASLTLFRSPLLEAKPCFQQHYFLRCCLFVPILLMLVLGIRSSFDHRPANPSDAIISDSKIINELTKNSFHNVAYSLYSRVGNNFEAEQYGKMATQEALRRFAKLMDIEEISGKSMLNRQVDSHFPTSKPKNLVIFIQESIGAQHVGSLGGEIGLMPNLDALSTEGIYFKNAYASGTRSINGIAGLVAGFPPLAGSGVVKRDKAQEGFFNISTLLKQFGYQSSFFYGGESRFDNMKSWFSGNGFDRIIEESDFEDPIFSGTWGVSDLDLVIKADEYFNNWNRQAQPFVSVVFSATNHSPFEYPENIIEPVAGVPTKHVKNTIKFADHAIGVLIDRARKNGYLEDTIFAVVADHNVRVYGDDKIPVSMYRIPALIMGGGIQPRSIERRVSQPDILATLVDLLGISATHPIMGHSIYSQPEATFSYFKYHDTYGLRKKDKIAILQPNQQAQTFLLDQSDNLLPAEQDHELNKDALAMLLSLQHIYQNRMYQ